MIRGFCIRFYLAAFPALATDDFIFVKTWPDGGIYQVALNGSTVGEPSLVVGGSDAKADAGITYDSVTVSIVWSVGNVIKRRSIVDGTTDVLLDLSSRSDFTGIIDIASDPITGNVYFAVGGVLGMVENGLYTREIYNGVDETFVAIDLDHLLPKLFGILRSTVDTSYVIMKLDIDASLSKRSVGDSPTQVIFTGSGNVFCISVDIHEQFIYSSDGDAIYRTDYDGDTGQTTFYVDTLASSIRDIDIVGNYIYFVGKDNPAIIRVNKQDNTSVTSIGPQSGLPDMNWLDVNIASATEIFCNTEDLVHATLSDACSLKAGEECNSFVCDSDYERNTNAEVLSCTASGSWSHNLSTICISVTSPTCSNVVKSMNCTGSWFHHYAECPIEGVTGDIVVAIAELLSSTCVYVSGQKSDYNGNDLVYGYTNTKIWIYNGCEATFHICSDNMCNIDDLEHATLPDTCSLNAGEICNNFVCDFGYEKSPSVTTLTCTESLVWSHDLSTICIASAPLTCSTVLKTITCTGSWFHHYSECPIEDVTGDIVVLLAELLSSSCVYFSGQKSDYGGNDLVYGFTNSKIWIYNGCEATFHICSASDKTCPPPDSKMLSFLCDSPCSLGGCGAAEICCFSDSCDSSVCVLPLEDQGPDANGCPYEPALYADDACAADPDGSCADNSDCGQGLVCCYSYECGDNWCVTPQQTENTCLGNILNGSLPTTCQSTAGESCDNFICDVGFKRRTGVTELRCSEIGEWSYNLSSLCVEVTCPMHIDHGHLSNNCSSNIKASCDEVICDAGHTRNNDVAALVCNDEGTWDYEVSFLCDSIDNAINCRVTAPTATLLPEWIDQLGNSCGYNICNDNYRSVENNYSVVCMSSETFEVYDVIRCSASECSNGQSMRFQSAHVLLVVLFHVVVTGFAY